MISIVRKINIKYVKQVDIFFQFNININGEEKLESFNFISKLTPSNINSLSKMNVLPSNLIIKALSKGI